MKLEQYTPPQQEAITTRDQQVLVVAGPGSGKTATTVARILHLIEDGVDPSKIVAITFTNAAAQEMQKRIAVNLGARDLALFGNSYTPALGHCGTLHSFALKMLKTWGTGEGYGNRMSLVSPESAENLLLSKAQTIGCKLKLDDLLQLKAKGRPKRGTRMDLGQVAVASYYQDLQQAGIVDFDILLTEFARLLTESPAFKALGYDYLFVDEVQDSGPVDWEIYLTLQIANKFFVGDPDQAIYGFRGGDINGMLWLAKQPQTTLIKLEQNFRSNEEICMAAQRLIEHNTNRIEKRTISVKGAGGQVTWLMPAANEGAEIERIARQLHTHIEDDTEIAVLCRTNAIAYDIQQQLDALGLPVVKRERNTLPKDWPLLRAAVELMVDPENDTLAYFYLVTLYQTKGATPKEARESAHAVRLAAAAVGKSINRANLAFTSYDQATCSLSKESRMILSQIIRDENPDLLGIALAVASYRDDVTDRKKSNGIHVLTIHASKGREFDAVFLAGWEDEIMPGRANSTKEIEEERRLAYVALTRARNFVMITNAQTRTTPWGAIAQHTPSRFIKELSTP